VIDVGVRLPLARLTRTPRGWIPVLAWAALAVVSAIVLHRTGTSATGGALEIIFGQLALPFIAFAIVGAVLGGDGLTRSIRPLVAFGASPARVALAAIGVAVVASAVVAGVLGAVIAVVSHGASDPPVARDALTSAWVAGLGAASYAALFAAGASFGKRGGGRLAALVVDLVLGSGTGAAALLAPRAHVRSLLGGDGVMGLPGRGSAVVLIVLTGVFVGVAVGRSRRA
jgi:hypothetical protein